MFYISEKDYVAQAVGPVPTASFIRATAGMSRIALKRAQKHHLAVLTDWQKQRDVAQQRYVQLVDAGEIVVPTRMQQLCRTAQGHPDREDTQAARRLLTKRSISWEV